MRFWQVSRLYDFLNILFKAARSVEVRCTTPYLDEASMKERFTAPRPMQMAA